jgi:hypothetical protein
MGEERICMACGRPLSGGQRKWCDRPDCDGWDAVHPPVTRTCECGRTFDTYKGSGKKKCDICSRNMVERICIQCGNKFTIAESRDFLWCEGRDLRIEDEEVDGELTLTYYHKIDGEWKRTTSERCYDRFFRLNPQPDYFKDDKKLKRNGLCFGCKKELDDEQREFGYCSAACDAVYQVRTKFRINGLRESIREKEGTVAAKVFNYAWIRQWFDLHPNHGERRVRADKGYQEEYRREYQRELRHMKIRKKLGIPLDASIPRDIPETTELPIKTWLEKNNIQFEVQHYIEVGATYTLVDFFIPIPDSDIGICIYCDGDYWHGPEFPETAEKDIMQIRELEKKGHVVLRLAEEDIQNGARPEEVLELLD